MNGGHSAEKGSFLETGCKDLNAIFLLIHLIKTVAPPIEVTQ